MLPLPYSRLFALLIKADFFLNLRSVNDLFVDVEWLSVYFISFCTLQFYVAISDT